MDILVYLSDQHAWQQQAYAGDALVRTPNLDRIAAAGTVMNQCYTNYPLCVPARMSMLTGQLPSRNGVMSNMAALDSNTPTLAHCLHVGGYETVLCGRMHFVGPDQRHGFSKRIAGDQTPIFHNRPTAAFKQERGAHERTPMGGAFSLEAIGGGDSPTLAFDRYVVEQAVDYLSEDHEKPQFLCVGTYAPHHPYVAPRELYEYYYDKVSLPEDTYELQEHPALAGQIVRDTDPEVVRAVRAAYYGMVEFTDQQVGRVYDAFQDYLQRTGREGVFVYVSDHGDHIGYRGYYGKSSFYEASAHIPMIFAGVGIPAGKCVEHPAALMDLCPTLCDLTGSPMPPVLDGISLVPSMQGERACDARMVISEVGGDLDLRSGAFSYGQMVRWKQFKLIHYDGYEQDDVLYDLDADAKETTNVIEKYPQEAQAMLAYAAANRPPIEQLETRARTLRSNLSILGRCDFDSEERWHVPECARHLPEPMVKSKLCQ